MNSPANPVNVTLPERTATTSTHNGHLRIAGLSNKSRKCYIFENMSAPLLSIDQLCDDGCIYIVTETLMWILKNNTPLVTGERDTNTGLWTVDITKLISKTVPGTNPLHHVSNASIVKETIAERVAFLHA